MTYHFIRTLAHSNLVLAFALGTPFALRAADAGQSFATPEEAVSALVAAASAPGSGALLSILGPASEELQNPDQVQAASELEAFSTAARQFQRIVHESDTTCLLEIGTNAWPFPVPIVKQPSGGWIFDVEAGKDELLNRRIGKNELSTLQVVRGYVGAQRGYASKDRDDDAVLEYGQKFVSSPGSKDGLYWSPDLDGEISPVGPFVARANEQGYSIGSREPGEKAEPFHGYWFKILDRQGGSAPGGAYDYIINGNMIGGFALVAWPAEHGTSGIMTFIVNQQGRVYQKDLGPETAKAVKEMRAYNPDPTWTVSPD